MAALASDDTWRDIVTKEVESISPMSMIVKSASVLYYGSYCTHDTTTGEIKPYDGTVGDRAVGWHFGESVTGNAAAPRVTGRIIKGGFQARKAVTGLHGTTLSTDFGKPVYISNDNDLTLTGTTTTHKVGFVVPNDEGVTVGTDAWVAFRDMFGKIGGE